MKVIALINEKGGTGKSSTASNLGTALHRRGGARVVLVDADSHNGLTDWRGVREEENAELQKQGRALRPAVDLPPVVSLSKPHLIASVRNLAADIVIIDAPANAADMNSKIIGIADIALLVMEPTGGSIRGSAATVKMIRQKLDLGGRVDAAILLNKVITGQKLSQAAVSGEWNNYGLDLMDNTISNRVAVQSAFTDGVSVYDLNDGTAKAEIDFLIDELENAKWL